MVTASFYPSTNWGGWEFLEVYTEMDTNHTTGRVGTRVAGYRTPLTNLNFNHSNAGANVEVITARDWDSAKTSRVKPKMARMVGSQNIDLVGVVAEEEEVTRQGTKAS